MIISELTCSVERHTSWTLNLNKSRTCWLSLSWTCETVILQSKDHEYKQRFYHGNNKIWRPNQWKGQVFQVRVVRLKTLDLFRIISIFYLTWPTQIWVIAIGFRTWFWISKCEKPHAYWGNKHEWCKQFKFFNFVDTLQPQKLKCLCGIPMDFHQRLRLRIFWKLCM